MMSDQQNNRQRKGRARQGVGQEHPPRSGRGTIRYGGRGYGAGGSRGRKQTAGQCRMGITSFP